ncbi:hypothetical protein BJX63DRAFT_416672 [Aspergillus granulosus]|uniref:Uncharacterized protein n=1 Tax=Aspergillus granulosus TaxID=176169 RepID=A0ABR4GRP9_9EURO
MTPEATITGSTTSEYLSPVTSLLDLFTSFTSSQTRVKVCYILRGVTFTTFPPSNLCYFISDAYQDLLHPAELHIAAFSPSMSTQSPVLARVQIDGRGHATYWDGMQQRPSVVESLRFQVPYVAFGSRQQTYEELLHSHPESTTPPEQLTASHQPKFFSWVTNNGYGARHASDLAPFSLWDDRIHDFRFPTLEERKWIFDAFRAESVTYSWPDIIIETRSPPNPIPLTVACVAATFIPAGSDCPYLATNTDYSNPRMSDPLSPHIQLPKWERPSKQQREAVLQALRRLATVQAVNYIAPIIIVEIALDGRSYSNRSLPGKIGGLLTMYHHSHTPFWPLACQGRDRSITPRIVQDTTNYFLTDHQTLCPGVRVECGDATMASTAGVKLRNTDSGAIRLTVSNHRFINSEVYHPSSRNGGVCIGHINERFEALDVALVKPYPSTTFTNGEYFQAQPPNRLLRSTEVLNNTWCCADGMASGAVYLKVAGIKDRCPPRPAGINVPFTEFITENIYHLYGPASSNREGVYGAPIVVDDNKDGGIVGFFQLGADGSAWALSPCLDDLIDRGWKVV